MYKKLISLILLSFFALQAELIAQTAEAARAVLQNFAISSQAQAYVDFALNRIRDGERALPESEIRIDGTLKKLGSPFPVDSRTQATFKSHGGFGAIFYVSTSDNHNFGVKASQASEEVTKEFNIWNALQGINHIPKVYAMLKSKNKIFIAMEWLSGDNVFNQLRSLNSKALLSIFDTVLDTIIAMHSKGFVHGDIKFKNIMYDPKTQKTVLVDFGESQDLTKKVGNEKNKLKLKDLEMIGSLLKSVDENLEPQAKQYFYNKLADYTKLLKPD